MCEILANFEMLEVLASFANVVLYSRHTPPLTHQTFQPFFFLTYSRRVLRSYGTFCNHATHAAGKFHGNVQLILSSSQYFCASSANQPILQTHCKPAKRAYKSIYPTRWQHRAHRSSAYEHADVLAPAHGKRISKCCTALRSSRRPISNIYASCIMLALRRRLPLSF